jgi:hypothetical protein
VSWLDRWAEQLAFVCERCGRDGRDLPGDDASDVVTFEGDDGSCCRERRRELHRPDAISILDEWMRRRDGTFDGDPYRHVLADARVEPHRRTVPCDALDCAVCRALGSGERHLIPHVDCDCSACLPGSY